MKRRCSLKTLKAIAENVFLVFYFEETGEILFGREDILEAKLFERIALELGFATSLTNGFNVRVTIE